MNTTKKETETYVLTDLDRLDPVTVYVTNYQPGQGKMVVECFGDAWAVYWGAMGDNNLQQFVLTCNNDYILNKMLKNTTQTDFDEINDIAHKRDFLLCVTSDVEITMAVDMMTELFGPDWMLELPTCRTTEYKYLNRILNAIKSAFSNEQKI